MGLLKSGMKYGVLYGVAREAGKAIGGHSNNQQQQQPLPQQSNLAPQQQRTSAPFTDSTGYLHQSFCNGQCGRKCNSGSSRELPGYSHKDFCNGSCQGTCNGGVSGGAAGEYYAQDRSAGQEGPAPKYEEKK